MALYHKFSPLFRPKCGIIGSMLSADIAPGIIPSPEGVISRFGGVPGIGEHLKRWRNTLVVAAGGAGLLLLETACGAPRVPESTPIPATPTLPADLTPQVFGPDVNKGAPIPPNTPTPEAKKTSTPETVPCVITSPDVCAQAERIQIVRKDIDGRIETYITLNPPNKTPFLVPEDGQLLDKIEESGDPFSGFSALLRKPNPPGGGYIIIGLAFDNMLQVENPKQGSLIGYSTDEITNYGAKVLVTITKRTPNGPDIDEEALKALFPGAYKKPIRLTYSPAGPGKPNVSISYSSVAPQ